VSGSKRRMLSTSRSSMSMRKGVSEAHGVDVDQRAPAPRIPPCATTWVTAAYPARANWARRASRVEAFADVNFEGIGFDVAAGRQPLQQRVDGDQPDALSGRAASAAKAASRPEVISGCAERSRRRAGSLNQGKTPTLRPAAGKESNFIAQRLRFTRTLRDDDERSPGPRRGPRRWRAPPRHRTACPI